ncbi:relaxase/mobilization nuclease domain-containing protein [Cytophagaceae bacterium DM2B3-1]|uniref:Relaxase/mobilization nuclease domain-containing protein n=1 Tax=Xanthocytophaga flava TaxID=3048013 RepID=A0ABT7CV98_9BACT|nr:relaxase/mobilization nuclease domain-containing protein [Xanthocytophaga flavus]MDJ1497591.1 relaxase/mobilization nuclease domain-containing protein [Xanthocytophaga flavus]
MIVKITTGKDIIGLINYNEQKVSDDEAVLLACPNMALGKGPDELTYAMKVGIMQQTINGKKGRKLEKPTMHISLSLHPSEKPSDEKLTELATEYMERMGYSAQPYLVYRHFDTAHPHIHIVTCKVDKQGNKIDENYQRIRSEKVRKQMEIDYGLLRAELQERKDQSVYLTVNWSSETQMPTLEAKRFSAVDSAGQKLNEMSFAESEDTGENKKYTKSTISSVISHILEEYHISNFKQYEALLATHGVKVIKVDNESQSRKGLVYTLLSKEGKQYGVAIKASAFYQKPTLTNLNAYFEKNISTRKEKLIEVKREVDTLLAKYEKISVKDFSAQLAHRGIYVTFHKSQNNADRNSTDRKNVGSNSQLEKNLSNQSIEPSLIHHEHVKSESKNETIKTEEIFGITFFDTGRKVILTGSELGKEYGWKKLSAHFDESTQVKKSSSDQLSIPISVNKEVEEDRVKINSPAIKKDKQANREKIKVTVSIKNPVVKEKQTNKSEDFKPKTTTETTDKPLIKEDNALGPDANEQDVSLFDINVNGGKENVSKEGVLSHYSKNRKKRGKKI